MDIKFGNQTNFIVLKSTGYFFKSMKYPLLSSQTSRNNDELNAGHK